MGNITHFGNVAQIGNMTSQSHDKETENVNKIKMEMIYPCGFASSTFVIIWESNQVPIRSNNLVVYI